MRSFSFAQLKGRDLFLLVVLGVAVLGLLWYYLLYSASKAEIDTKKTELDSLVAEVAASRAAADQLPALREEVAKLEVQRDELLRALPPTARVGAVLGEIRGNVGASGSELVSLAQSAGTAGGLPAGVRPMGLNLSLKGTFGELYHVLRSLEDMSRFSTINSLNLSLGQADSMNPKLTGQVGVTLYTFDPAAAGAQGTAPQGAAPGGTAPGNAPASGTTPAAPAPAAPPAGGAQ